MSKVKLAIILSTSLLLSVMAYALLDRRTATQVKPPAVESTAVQSSIQQALPSQVKEDSIQPDLPAMDDSTQLDDIQALLIKLEQRMTSLESDVNAIRVDQNGRVDSATTVSAPESEDDSSMLSVTGSVADPEQAKLSRVQYFLGIDQQISAELKPRVSDDVSNRFETLFNSREDWGENVNLDTSECGSQYCKIVVTYPRDLDPISEFELEGSLYMPTVADYPNSKSFSTVRADGRKELTMYFSAKDTNFPPQ